MKTLKLIGVILTVALFVTACSASVMAMPGAIPSQIATVVVQTESGLTQLIVFLDLNGNGELDKGEPVLKTITLTAGYDDGLFAIASIAIVVMQTESGLTQLIVFLDLNGNGELDKGEPVLDTITLTEGFEND